MKKTIEQKLKEVGDFSILVTKENRNELKEWFKENFFIECGRYNPCFKVGFRYGYFSQECLPMIRNINKGENAYNNVLTIQQAKQLFCEDDLGFPRMMIVSDIEANLEKESYIKNPKTVVEKCKLGWISEEEGGLFIWKYAKELPQKTKIPTSELIKLGKQAYASQNDVNIDLIEEV